MEELALFYSLSSFVYIFCTTFCFDFDLINTTLSRFGAPKVPSQQSIMDMHGMTMSTATSTGSAAMASSTGMDMSGMDMGNSCKISVRLISIPDSLLDTPDSSLLTVMIRCSGTGTQSTHVRSPPTPLYKPTANQPSGFLAESWHIKSRGMFAGSCIGVICLVLSLELLRRLGREYDSFIVRRARLRRLYMSGSSTAQSISHVPLRSEEGDTTKPANCCGGNAEPDFSADDDLITPLPSSPQNGASKKQASVSAAAAPANALRDVGVQRIERQEAMLAPYRPSIVEHSVRSLLHMAQFAVAYIIMLLAMYFNGYIIICIFIGAFLGAFIFSWEPVNLNQE